MAKSISLPDKGALPFPRNLFVTMRQWFDSDYFPEGADAIRQRPNAFEFRRSRAYRPGVFDLTVTGIDKVPTGKVGMNGG